MTLAGPRVYYAMAQDGLFLPAAAPDPRLAPGVRPRSPPMGSDPIPRDAGSDPGSRPGGLTPRPGGWGQTPVPVRGV
jgi:hypothetical protein